MEKHTVIAVSTYYADRVHWHKKVAGTVEVEGRYASWNGKPFFFVNTDFGLNQKCVAVILEDGAGVRYKLYTETPAHGATVPEVLEELGRQLEQYTSANGSLGRPDFLSRFWGHKDIYG